MPGGWNGGVNMKEKKKLGRIQLFLDALQVLVGRRHERGCMGDIVAIFFRQDAHGRLVDGHDVDGGVFQVKGYEVHEAFVGSFLVTKKFGQERIFFQVDGAHCSPPFSISATMAFRSSMVIVSMALLISLRRR